MNTLRSPQNADEFALYYQLRWQILRKPWQQALGSEQDAQEKQSIHRMLINEQGQVLAVGRLELCGPQRGQIRYMAVCKTAQHQGLGKQIIKALEQQASKLGINEILLNARENAVGFYLQLGYQQHELSYVLFDEINHYKMTKQLAVQPKHQLIAAQALQRIWYNTIPMSKAMGLQISYYDTQQLITHCDAAFNKNLHNTMFAGSIYTLATLTGWGWIYLTLGEYQKNSDIVLAKANICYHTPIQGLTYGQVLDADVLGDLAQRAQGNKAHIKVTAHIYCGEIIAATFTGSYLVLPK